VTTDQPITSSAHGRVDPDGTGWLVTADGEVTVGSYLAGGQDEAWAFFVRRFDGVAAEVELLIARVGSGEIAPADAERETERLTEVLQSPNGIGDYAALRSRLETVRPKIAELKARKAQEKAQARATALAAREAIVVEAEGLADAERYREASTRLRELLDEWKNAPRVDRAAEQALWRRFSAARNRFERRRRAAAAEAATARAGGQAEKESIVAEAEALSGSTEWRETAAAYRGLMDRWKASGRAARGVEDKLWARFRAAQDAFFTARQAAASERDAAQAGNLATKEALAAEAEALLPVTDLEAARRTLREIQDRWEAAGQVPREARGAVDGRLRAVENALRHAEESRWQRTNPEGLARARSTVDQLTASLVGLERDLAAATESGDADRIASASEAIEQRRAWLVEAERALAEFGG
jgi:Domain of Unknown Function (DUF349)